ncbi:MAG: cell division protein FtsK/SpoIIIE [Frankiales bacterium]|nr:cell division protein FtsK/SpoIIIE [Frankiales bacterium]
MADTSTPDAAPSPAPAPRSTVPAVALLVCLGLVLGVFLNRWLLLLVVVAPALGYVGRRQAERTAALDRRRAEQAHTEGESLRAADAAGLLEEELQQLRGGAPDPAALAEDIAMGPALWAGDGELRLRLGTGDLPSQSVPGAVLRGVPVNVSLTSIGVLGVAGVGGRGLARWLVAQAAAQRSPQELSIWLLADPARTGLDAEWGWLRTLPHNAGQPERSARLIGATEEAVAARVEELTALIAHRASLTGAEGRGPDLLVVLDGANALRSLPGVRQLLTSGPAVGVHLVCVAELVGALPAECKASASLTPGALELRAGDAPPLPVVPDTLDPARADRLVSGLPEGAPPAPDPLPTSARLLDLLELPELTADAVTARWGTNAAPVVAYPGVVVALEPGPVLVVGDDAGQTAALLRSVVASLALSYRPDALSVVLVGSTDGLTGAAGLPHVVSVLSDPDSATAARVLASLSAELDRRGKVLASVAATDIGAYFGAGHRSLPRLVVVVDDAAALLPELRAGLLALAAQGQSAGMHLVLATADLAAVPTELVQRVGQRLVLRIGSSGDSRRVLGTSAASELLVRAAGRGNARLGDGPVIAFQAGSVDGGPLSFASAATSWESLGEPIPLSATNGPSDLERIVAVLKDMDLNVGTAPWLPPLPDTVLLSDLGEVERSLTAIPWGLEDRPGEQAQQPVCWDVEHGGHLLVVGTRESGRSTMLRTLAVSLAQRATPSDLHLYALDSGDGSLACLADLPHCGAVVSVSEPERAERLLGRLAAEVVRRQRQLADRGFTDLAAQRAGTADPLPYLVLLVDSWERFVEAHGWVDDGPLHDTLADVLRDGAAVGVRVVMSGDRSVLTSDLALLLGERIALRLDERADYLVAGVTPSAVPEQVRAGRGFRSAGGAVNAVQIALLPSEASSRGQAEAVAELAKQLPPARGRRPFRVDVPPRQISVREAQELAVSGPGAPFAAGGDELRLQTVNLAACGPGFTISGPAGSGRSTALLVLATALLATDTQLCLITPGPSPLRELADAEGVLLAADGPDRLLAGVLERAKGRVAIVIDDADQLRDPDLDTLLREELSGGRASDHSVVLTGSSEWLFGGDSGFAFEAQRSRSGLLLSPDSPERGELFGVHLPREAVFSGPPGRGVLVRSGQLQVVQVPLPNR